MKSWLLSFIGNYYAIRGYNTCKAYRVLEIVQYE